MIVYVCSLPRRPEVCLRDHIDVSKEAFCEITGKKTALQELRHIFSVQLASK